MNKLNVTKFGIQELKAEEMVEVEGGGKVHWFMYLVSPASAYVLDRFLEGVENGVKNR
ncbi:hypothetical protein [Sphingobacterium psychroaquaticum]|uniref:hypothetical protein n=1 Tax=Sphingobacterium psychroaquaticum TaxID=561061 RepID=UPI00141B9EFB|nr:hypothetical protein [Sphingobacterium psychroaquaticum]